MIMNLIFCLVSTTHDHYSTTSTSTSTNSYTSTSTIVSFSLIASTPNTNKILS